MPLEQLSSRESDTLVFAMVMAAAIVPGSKPGGNIDSSEDEAIRRLLTDVDIARGALAGEVFTEIASDYEGTVERFFGDPRQYNDLFMEARYVLDDKFAPEEAHEFKATMYELARRLVTSVRSYEGIVDVLRQVATLMAYKRPIYGFTLDQVEAHLRARRVRWGDTRYLLEVESDAVDGRLYERDISNQNNFEIHVWESEEAASAARPKVEQQVRQRDRLFQADNVLAVVHGRRRAPADEHPLGAAMGSLGGVA